MSKKELIERVNSIKSKYDDIIYKIKEEAFKKIKPFRDTKIEEIKKVDFQCYKCNKKTKLENIIYILEKELVETSIGSKQCDSHATLICPECGYKLELIGNNRDLWFMTCVDWRDIYNTKIEHHLSYNTGKSSHYTVLYKKEPITQINGIKL